MRPILYEQNETLFENNGIGILHDAETCTVTEVRNGEFELEMEYPLNGDWIGEIRTERYILAKPNDFDEPHAFRIYETDDDLDGKKRTVKAVTSTDSLSGILVKPFAAVTSTPMNVWERIKAHAVDPINIKFATDITTTSAMQHDEIKNVLSLISGTEGSMVDVFGGEVLRTNNQIYLYRRRGHERVTTIRPRKNLKNIKIVTSMSGKYTSILPYAKYTPEGENQKEVVVYGDVVRSKYYNDYFTKRMSPIDVTSKVKEGKKDQEVKVITKAMVDKVSKKYFDENYGVDLPNIKIDVDMVPLSDTTAWEKAIIKALINIKLCDTVEVYVPKIGVNITVKVNKIEYDVLSERIKKISASTSGHDRSTLAEVQRAEWKQMTNKVIADVLAPLEESVNTVISSLDGKNQNFFGPDTPPTEGLKANDIWYKTIGEGEVEMYRYDGTQWNLIIPANFGDAIDKKIADYEKEIKSKLDEFSVSNEAMKVKVDKVTSDANEILKRASKDQAAQIAAAQSKLAQIEKDFNTNREYLTRKIGELIASGTQDELALSTYKQEVNHHLAELEKTMVSYGGEVSNIKTLISQTNEKIELAAEKYNEVKGDVNAAKARLKLIPNEINLAVSNASGESKKYTDAQIKLSEGRITSFVTSSLNGTVSGLISSSVVQEAGIIRQAITSAKNDMLSAARINTNTVVETKIGELRQSLVETMKSIPKKYGGRNYISRSDRPVRSGRYVLNGDGFATFHGYSFIGGQTLKELGLKLNDRLIIQYKIKFDSRVTNARSIVEFYSNTSFIGPWPVNIPDYPEITAKNISSDGWETRVGYITLTEEILNNAIKVQFRVDDTNNVPFTIKDCILHSADSVVDWSAAVEDNLYDTGGQNLLRNGDFQLNISTEEKAKTDFWDIVHYDNDQGMKIDLGNHGYSNFNQAKGIVHFYGTSRSYHWIKQKVYNLNLQKGDMLTLSADIATEEIDRNTWNSDSIFAVEMVTTSATRQEKSYRHHFRNHEDGIIDLVLFRRAFNRVGYSFKLEEDAVEVAVKFVVFPNKTLNLYFRNFQLEQTKFINGFKKNPLDVDLTQNTKFQEVVSRVDLFSRTIGENENGINTKIAQMVMKSDEIQSFVQNGGSPSNNIILDTDTFENALSNLTITPGVMVKSPTPGNYGKNPYRISVYKTNDTQRWRGVSLPLTIQSVKVGDTFTVSFKYKINSAMDKRGSSTYAVELKDHTRNKGQTIWSIGANSTAIEFNKWLTFKRTFNIDKDMTFDSKDLHPFYFWVDKAGDFEIAEIMMARGNKLPDEYSPASWGSATMVNQLSNSYAIRALNSANSIVSEVNVNTNGIRFKGKNLEFDGNALIHNGVIKNAHIADATISSAKVASLDASKVVGLEGVFNTLIARKATISRLFTDGIDIGNTTTLYASNGVLQISHKGGLTKDVTISSNGRISSPTWFNGQVSRSADFTPVMTNVWVNSPLNSLRSGVNVYGVRGLFMVTFSGQTNEYGSSAWLYVNDGSSQNHTYYVPLKKAETQYDWNKGFI
jgi:phage minor structural protein, N-terminal domain protein|nr:MAG TPA: tail protein [Caudoviricetes sp.]